MSRKAQLTGQFEPESNKNMEILEHDFDGVFRFTNATDEDFIAFWNNKEYTLPAGKTVPLIIPGEPLENIQEIRKKWAYQLATREFYKGKVYKEMSKKGNGLPPTFDEKILEPMIEECLKPLPVSKVKVREGKKDSEKNYKGSKAISEKDNPNFVFKDEKVEVLGQMPDK